MPATHHNLLPLEALLEEHSRLRQSEFPRRDADYFARYATIKQHLSDNYYRVAGAGLAREGGRYTLHDIGHVEDVIKTEGQLLGLGSGANTPVIDRLSPYEIYALLVATLLHDAGNAMGRADHEKAALSLLVKLGPVADLDSFERRVIGQIAQAHGGKTADGDKDTIGKLVSPAIADIGGVKVRGRVLAAILRFADELSENTRRVDEHALEKPYQAPISVLPNLFCKNINITVDYHEHSISINFLIDRQLLLECFRMESIGIEAEGYFVDYIAARLKKCEQERRYCNRFLANFVTYDRIRVKVEILDGTDAVSDVGFILEDNGYPEFGDPVAEAAPNFSGTWFKNNVAEVPQNGA